MFLNNIYLKFFFLFSFLFLFLNAGYGNNKIENCGIYDYSRISNAPYLPLEGCYFKYTHDGLNRFETQNQIIHTHYNFNTEFEFRLENGYDLQIGFSDHLGGINDLELDIKIKQNTDYSWSTIDADFEIDVDNEKTYTVTGVAPFIGTNILEFKVKPSANLADIYMNISSDWKPYDVLKEGCFENLYQLTSGKYLLCGKFYIYNNKVVSFPKSEVFSINECLNRITPKTITSYKAKEMMVALYGGNSLFFKIEDTVDKPLECGKTATNTQTTQVVTSTDADTSSQTLSPDTPSTKSEATSPDTPAQTTTPTAKPAQTTTPKAPEFWKKFFERFRENLGFKNRVIYDASTTNVCEGFTRYNFDSTWVFKCDGQDKVIPCALKATKGYNAGDIKKSVEISKFKDPAKSAFENDCKKKAQ